MRRIALASLLGVLSIAPATAENTDPAGDGSQYAWTENAGWINAEPGGDGGDGLQVSDFALTGWMWSENAGWISLSCANTGTCASSNYGVTNNGHGKLGGFAWSENAGWINFASTGGSVGIDPGTGAFNGYAWGENAGWISFSCANTGTCGSSAYGVKTGWCQSTPSVPAGSTDLRASRVGGSVLMSNLVLAGGATWHELVGGRLSTLRSTGGNFKDAMLGCGGERVLAPSVVVPVPDPPPGDGFWFLARRGNCKGKGTFDSGAPSQSGSRDAEIAASGLACP
jgi:hypothetical protein